MKKFTKKLQKFFKRFAKIFFRISNVITEEVLTYKKTLVVITLALIFTGLIVFGKGMVSSTLANTIVVSESEILRRIRTHTTIPSTQPTSIVRVKDAEVLRAQHMFYKDIKEGDYIIMYPDRVIIYDLRADTVIGEKSSQ
jgi:hypothetical protein